MTRFTKDEILVRNGDFELLDERAWVSFVHKSGQKAATDALSGAIWAALPGTADEVVGKVTSVWAVSDELVRDYLWLMRRAEVVLRAGEAGEERGPEKTGVVAGAGLKKPAAGGALAGPAGAEVVRSETGAEGEPEKRAGGESAEPAGDGKGPDRDKTGADGNAGARNSDLISVVVITHNGADHVVDCLGSLTRQTHKNVEIIAVDNASSDGTPDIIRDRFPEVRLLVQSRNLHYAGGVNVGLRSARGKYLFVVNQDTEMAGYCLARLFERARAGEDIGAVVPMMKFFHLRGFINGLGNQIRNHGWGTDNYIGHIDLGQFADLTEVPSACFGAVFLSRKALDSVGPLDESYGSFYEDVDWSFRCWMGGFRIVAGPQAVVYHKFGGSYLQRPKLQFVARNRQRLVLKLFQGRVMLGVFKRYLKEDLRNFFGLLKRKNFGMAMAYPKAYVSLGLGLAGTLSERRKARKRKLPHLRELDVFRRNFDFYHALDERGFPRLDASILLGHYRWVMKKRADGVASTFSAF